MEFSVPSSVLLVVLISVSSSKLGRSAYDEYHHPHLGAAGVVANEYLPRAEGEREGEFFPHAGIVGTTASLLFDKALRCLTDKSIYTACEETHRLSESGELHVLPDDTDKYCNGPCLAETHHALDCIEGIVNGFIFLNTATLNDIRHTIEDGCGYGPHRGNFDVLQHINKQDDEPAEGSGNDVNGPPVAAFCTLLVLIVGLRLLF